MNETEYVLVDAISQYRMRYLVEVPKGKTEWAHDTVAMEEAKEFSQKHLGETIISSRVISLEQAVQLFKVDNDYLKEWSEEQVLATALTQMKEYIK